MSISAFGDGLDVLNAEETTADEIAAFRAFYTRVKGGPLPAHEFLLEFRPDMLKRHRAIARELTDRENEKYPLVHTLAHLHYYLALGFGEGIRYEIVQARAGGARRTDVLDVIAVGQLHACTLGLAAAAHEATGTVREWTDDGAGTQRFPPHWAYDPQALSSGLDFSDSRCTDKEAALVQDWYRRTLGEVPSHVTFLARYRPDVLKAQRHRYEKAIRDSLPKQAMPWLQLHLAVSRRSVSGIRENVLLARAFGLKQSEVLDAISWGIFYGGTDAIATVADTIGDLLEAWPAANGTET